MAGGMKSLIINTQERAVSVDINRSQSFKNKDISELFRYWMDVQYGSYDLDAAALATETSTLGTPLQAEILGGLLVQPQIATTTVNVSPGVLLGIAPDGGADDSNYKYVRDPGSTGTLAIASNSAGSTRIDVVEVQIGNVISETDNRDIFNPSTGLFAATTVNKANQDALTYRVRQGTPGSGFPGAASGWLPLAVASVPNGSTTNDTVTFWDVRPLLSDRRYSPFTVGQSKPYAEKLLVNPGTTPTAVSGWGNWTAQVGSPAIARRLGGRIRRGTPGTDNASTMDITDVANQDGTVTANKLLYMYLLTPFSLPRWARYTDASFGSRVPRSPRGIPVVSTVNPDVDGNPPGGGITLPTSTGLVGSTTNGICIWAGFTSAGPTLLAPYGDETGQALLANLATPAGTIASNTAQIALTPGTHYPPNAKWIHIAFTLSMTASGTAGVDGQNWSVQIYAPGSSSTIQQTHSVTYKQSRFNSSDTYQTQIEIWVPVPPVYPSVTAPASQVYGLVTAGSGTITALAGNIIGWRM